MEKLFNSLATCWVEKVDVTPQEVREAKKVDLSQRKAETNEETNARNLENASRELSPLNERIAEVEDKIRDEVIYDFKLNRFSYLPRIRHCLVERASIPEISFGAELYPYTTVNLLKAKKLTALIEEMGEIALSREMAYRETKDDFWGLRGQIIEFGGMIKDERPYFCIILPAREGFGTIEHRILANKYNYLQLKSYLDDLEDVLQAKAKETEASQGSN